LFIKEVRKCLKNMSRPQKGASFASSVPGTFEEFVLTVANDEPTFNP